MLTAVLTPGRIWGSKFGSTAEMRPRVSKVTRLGLPISSNISRLGTKSSAAKFSRRVLARERATRGGSRMTELDKQRAVELLNRILEAELAGVVRYTHYSFLVFGHNRIPIVSWLREQAAESLTHAQPAVGMIALLGEYPSL